jgi:hypothetical protein
MEAKRRGRPEEHSLKVRAALEEKEVDQRIQWKTLAMKYGFDDTRNLERAVQRLKVLLKREGILPLTPEECKAARIREADLRSKGILPPLDS